jgi:aminopeptidase
MAHSGTTSYACLIYNPDMSASFEERLQRYARLTILGGINIQSGQELIIGADVSEAPFVRLLTEEAYKAGATNVFVMYSDEPTTLIRYAHGSDEAIAYAPKWFAEALGERVESGAAYLRVYGSNPALLKDVDPKKVAISGKAGAEASKKMQDAFSRMLSNFAIVGHPSAAWAQAVFPDERAELALSKLWNAVFTCTGVDEEDPVKAWNDHCAGIESRRDMLNAKNFKALHFKGPGTDLNVGLADGQRFAGGRVITKRGIICSPNVPTEEVFGMPHKDRVDGVVHSTKPLSVRGRMVDGIEMEFRHGVVVSAAAKEGNEVLQRLLDTDEGARRLGEVALVPNNSRVNKADILFLNTLYDENAACHIAIGQALGENMDGYGNLSPEERAAKGANNSLIHVDWMIGSDQVDIDGITQAGSHEPLMRSGEWV